MSDRRTTCEADAYRIAEPRANSASAGGCGMLGAAAAGQGKRLRIGLTKWGWVPAGRAGAVGGRAAFAEYSMQPDFCRSCHIMEPYYQAWHHSTHKNVPCVDCHFEPGLENTLNGKLQASSQAVKYITHTYGSKPHAEIHDVSCLRSGCHEKRLLEGKVNWTVTHPARRRRSPSASTTRRT